MMRDLAERLSQAEESKLIQKLASAEKCPWHGIQPEIVGPKRMPKTFYSCHSLSIEAWLFREFPAAILFPTINWTCFCPKCAKKSPIADKHNKFGYGLSSQYSWQAALGNWNKACLRYCKKMILNHLKTGEVQISEEHI